MINFDITKIKDFSKKLTALLVLPSNIESEACINYFNKFFSEIIFTTNTDEALSIFEKSNIDIIITDVEVSGNCCFELISKMKKQNKKLISIIYTNESNEEYFLKSINSGINGYLLKPLKEEDFFSILDRALKQYEINFKNKKIKTDLKNLKKHQKELNKKTVISGKKNLIHDIEENNLSLLILVQIEEFDMLDKFYNIDTVNSIEDEFANKILDYLPNNYAFEDIYSLDNGQFALLTDFFEFSKCEVNLNTYLKNFIKNVKESLLVIDEIEYDLNIILSYSFGKMHLYEDAKCGLDDAIKKNEMINFSNDYSIKEHIEAKKNIEVMKMVKIALDNYKIVSYFQPIINNKSKKIEKYESLVRLVDERGVVLAPEKFLEVSKKGNYYNKITHRVLENSFKILEHINTKLSINLSSLDIEKDETREKLYTLLKEHEHNANRIVFELLEDEQVKNFKVIRIFIRKVKKMGVKIAIDDFGTGYSNFERLLKFEPDILKIDGSLVRNIAKDELSKNIIETIVNFAKKQKIETIAEYVENEQIFNILNNLGVDYSQGYYFGKPENINFLKN